MVKKSNH